MYFEAFLGENAANTGFPRPKVPIHRKLGPGVYRITVTPATRPHHRRGGVGGEEGADGAGGSAGSWRRSPGSGAWRGSSRTRWLRHSRRARPHLCRFNRFRRVLETSTGPWLHDSVTPSLDYRRGVTPPWRDTLPSRPGARRRTGAPAIQAVGLAGAHEVRALPRPGDRRRASSLGRRERCQAGFVGSDTPLWTPPAARATGAERPP
jgi:hypothetical protein